MRRNQLGSAADNTIASDRLSLGPTSTSIRFPEVIEPLDPLERPEHSCQEQLCVPLVPGNTYWYLEATPELLSVVGRRMSVLFEAES